MENNLENPNQQTKPIVKSLSKKYKIYIILAIFIIFLSGYFIGKNEQYNWDQQFVTGPETTRVTIMPTPTLPPRLNNCKLYGMQDKSNYLPVYVTKKGDSLSLIAQNQLGDSTRVNEIIELNKENYPELSFSEPFIEIGWKLLLPPSGKTKISGPITARSGNINITDKNWSVLDERGLDLVEFNLEDLNKYQPTKANPSPLKNGDCVTVLYQVLVEIKPYVYGQGPPLNIFKQ